MTRFILRRIAYSFVVLLVASAVTFIGISIVADPTARLAQNRDPMARARMRQELGLDKPVIQRYGKWLGSAVTGDFGRSWQKKDSVIGILMNAMKYTAWLVIPGFIIAAVLAFAIGTYSAIRQYSAGDYFFTGASFVGISMPQFWFALILIEIFVFTIPSAFGMDPYFRFIGIGDTLGDRFKYLFLPVCVLVVQIVAEWSRYHRASMLDILPSDYIRSAHARGVPKRTVVLKHATKNALVPLIVIMAIDAGLIVGGLVVTEQVFSIPGMGRVFVEALEYGDAPMLTAWVVLTAVAVVLFNLLADIINALLDPRVRLA
ncbi:MAG: ABC transporter permease [Acidobacteria bacterium]|nr:ABC transporter permease [Acidobacteriota bacterium]